MTLHPAQGLKAEQGEERKINCISFDFGPTARAQSRPRLRLHSTQIAEELALRALVHMTSAEISIRESVIKSERHSLH